jgi:glycosyltransferase involved in cell wall biosynthesis
MKVLLLSDVPDGWIVSRIADRMVAEMPDIQWERGHYCCMSTAEIVERAATSGCDLIHAMNWNFADHLPGALQADIPILVSVRSHRYPASFREAAKLVHVHAISRALQAEFPGSAYIPDGVMIEPQPLRVGFAGKPGPYKGTHLIEAACKRIGARFLVAAAVPAADMVEFYEHIDVLCCASEAEGFGAPVMEALAMNKPVVSTRVGAAWEAHLPGVTWADRTVDGIASGLLTHWHSRYVERFTWARVCGEMRELYGRVAAR